MNGQALRVWLVDDDASIRWVLERALRSDGMAPRAFEAAEPALDALRRESPDVLITDIRMPGASGLELLRRIRDARPALPVIVMTAHSDLGNAVSAYEGGAFEYLPKPFDIDQAVALVRRAASAGQPPGGEPPGAPRIPELLGRAPAMQQVFRAIGRLARVLAEGEFYRVGGQTPIRVDVRVIAASHQNLQERVTHGLFREDLYHRLNVIRIELPPLRARAEDIPDLLAYYLVVSAHELGVDPKSLGPEALARLTAYEWPGNVRELVNLCRRLSVLAPGSEVHLADLPPELASLPTDATAQADWATALERWAERHALAGQVPLLDTAQPQFERVLIRAALKRTQGHRQEAARLLGWGRNTLTRKLRDLGMTAAGDDE